MIMSSDNEFSLNAFGVVLLEILTDMKVYNVNRSMETQNTVKWAIQLLADEVNLGRIMDLQLPSSL